MAFDIPRCIWVETSESVVGDVNMDGKNVDELDQSGAVEGEQPQMEMGNDM